MELDFRMHAHILLVFVISKKNNFKCKGKNKSIIQNPFSGGSILLTETREKADARRDHEIF